MQRSIEEYTTTLASDHWMRVCESINGQTHASKVSAILRTLLGQRKIYNDASRVALREGISAQEFAKQATQVFFPQTSHPTDTMCQNDESSQDSELLDSSFTMLKLEHASQHANAHWSAEDDLSDTTPEETPSSSAAQRPDSLDMQENTPWQPSTSQSLTTRQLRPPEVRRPPDRYGDFV
ncbi:hypothetical protein MTO96_020499 [Rhipicephalus appendiculatus]